MNLTQTQRRRIQDGSTSLLFSYDEGVPVQGPCCVVLDVEERRRIADHLGNVTVVPPKPVFWIEVTSIKRHTKGGWKVSFDVWDQREHPEYLGPNGTYTTSRFRAIDELEVVPRKYQNKLAKDVEKEWERVRLERTAAARVERARFRRERQRVARFLSAA